MEFFDELESGVREWVRKFRDAGINTTCSCHHEGYIYCQSSDPIEEVLRIRELMTTVRNYDIEVTYSINDGCCSQSIKVRSREFKCK